jgi:hypothetical protein
MELTSPRRWPTVTSRSLLTFTRLSKEVGVEACKSTFAWHARSFAPRSPTSQGRRLFSDTCLHWRRRLFFSTAGFNHGKSRDIIHHRVAVQRPRRAGGHFLRCLTHSTACGTEPRLSPEESGSCFLSATVAFAVSRCRAGVRRGESPEAAAVRELEEETILRATSVTPLSHCRTTGVINTRIVFLINARGELHTNPVELSQAAWWDWKDRLPLFGYVRHVISRLHWPNQDSSGILHVCPEKEES